VHSARYAFKKAEINSVLLHTFENVIKLLKQRKLCRYS